MTTAETGVTALPSSRSTRLGVLFFVIAPIVGLILAIWLSWGRGVYALDIIQLVFWHSITGLGVTVGFHRLFTHASFKTYSPVKATLGILGSMTAQGNLFQWCAVHMKHHRYSDGENDPHSPHAYGDGLLHGQMDPSWWIIKGLEWLGLASGIRVPEANAIQAKRKQQKKE